MFQAIDPAIFATCIATHLTTLGFEMLGRQMAIDGTRSGATENAAYPGSEEAASLVSV